MSIIVSALVFDWVLWVMNDDFGVLLEDASALNADLFSLTRLQLLAGLSYLNLDGATYSDLKISLGITDGALYANLGALEKMGLIQSKKVALENKKVEAYTITTEGITQWQLIRTWLQRLAGYGGNNR
jgi:DNA-binding MarR family transcriptional regulator